MEGTDILKSFKVGRRKRATARVRLISGNGTMTVNGISAEKYFPSENLIRMVQRPFKATNCLNKYDVIAILSGGGLNGQAGAMSLGIARWLIMEDPQLKTILRKEGLLTRDSREKERKKYGQRGARRRFQFSKR